VVSDALLRLGDRAGTSPLALGRAGPALLYGVTRSLASIEANELPILRG
jgi:hypothetical protein